LEDDLPVEPHKVNHKVNHNDESVELRFGSSNLTDGGSHPIGDLLGGDHTPRRLIETSGDRPRELHRLHSERITAWY